MAVDQDILARMRDLHHQATVERSHNYTGGVLTDAIAEVERLRKALASVASVQREIEFTAYAAAGNPQLMGVMKMYAVWAGTLKAALTRKGAPQ